MHDYALFGYHGGSVNITDGRYVYMRNPAAANSPCNEYTLMPCHMREQFCPAELQDTQMAPPFPFTKGGPVMKIPTQGDAGRLIGPHRFGNKLYDLTNDSGQLESLDSPALESKLLGVMSVKHYAANNQEHRRMSVSAEMNERTLREIYLSAFETVVKQSHLWTVMCNYNRINGEYVSQSKKMLNDILREEWGFDGYVMTNWGATDDRVAGLLAGQDLEMPGSGGVNDREIVAAVQNGSLDEAVLDCAVARILTVNQRQEAIIF